jgi:hypothetical protein
MAIKQQEEVRQHNKAMQHEGGKVVWQGNEMAQQHDKATM